MKIYNTLQRKKIELPRKQEISFYACGPTVYHYAHLGNLRAYIFMDILRKSLELDSYKVNLVVNITDVGHLTDDADSGEDKMEKGAKREGKTVWEIAKYYTDAFMQDIKKLNIKQPNTWCKATDHIKEQIELIQKIEQNGYTYKTSDGIYFDTSKLKEYGELIPNFDASKLEAGKRIDMGEKKNPTDFALWKFSNETKRAMEWESPWGTGFPGWHIECTAMACKYLGNQFDIHTGGIDHIPIHHTNEIAQARGAFGHSHVKYWMHSEFLQYEGGKMSKSDGNILTLSYFETKGFEPSDYRYFCLLTHYRKPLNFTWEAIEAARNARTKIVNKIQELKQGQGKINEELYSEFKEAMLDDLNTPKAIATLQKTLQSKISDEDKLETIKEMDKLLSLDLIKKQEIPSQIKELIEKREQARKIKDYKKSDELRDQIQQLGFIVKDTPNGPIIQNN